MNVRARDVVRLAKRLGRRLERGSWDNCAVGFLASTVNTSYFQLRREGHSKLTRNLILAIEAGFEGHSGGWFRGKESRYYRVGQNIHKLARQAKILVE